MDGSIIKAIGEFCEQEPKLYEEIKEMFTEVHNSIMYKIMNNLKLFYIYKRSECKKFLNIFDALNNLTNDEILIYFDALQLYGIFTHDSLGDFLEDHNDTFDDHIANDDILHRILPVDGKQILSFVCNSKYIHSGKLLRVMKDVFGDDMQFLWCNVDCIDKIQEITVKKYLSFDERNKSYAKIVEILSNNNGSHINDIWINNTIKNCKYQYTTSIYYHENETNKVIDLTCDNELQIPETKKLSKGAEAVRDALTKNNIEFIVEHRFSDCKNINTLPFDFYLPKYNACIEYDGEHHAKPVEFWGGQGAFEGIQKRDLINLIKTNYCRENKIPLLRINHTIKICDIETVILEFYDDIEDLLSSKQGAKIKNITEWIINNHPDKGERTTDYQNRYEEFIDKNVSSREFKPLVTKLLERNHVDRKW